jgi:hypothetical protein
MGKDMTVNDDMARIWKEAGVAYFKARTEYFMGRRGQP